MKPSRNVHGFPPLAAAEKRSNRALIPPILVLYTVCRFQKLEMARTHEDLWKSGPTTVWRLHLARGSHTLNLGLPGQPQSIHLGAERPSLVLRHDLKIDADSLSELGLTHEISILLFYIELLTVFLLS